MFYEQNLTFTMYPVDITPVYLDVYCCNVIDQCAINTFAVKPYDTTPVSTFGTGISPYVIQYDAYGGVGEVFTWGKSAIYFTDSDSNSDTLDTAY